MSEPAVRVNGPLSLSWLILAGAKANRGRWSECMTRSGWKLQVVLKLAEMPLVTGEGDQLLLIADGILDHIVGKLMPDDPVTILTCADARLGYLSISGIGYSVDFEALSKDPNAVIQDQGLNTVRALAAEVGARLTFTLRENRMVAMLTLPLWNLLAAPVPLALDSYIKPPPDWPVDLPPIIIS